LRLNQCERGVNQRPVRQCQDLPNPQRQMQHQSRFRVLQTYAGNFLDPPQAVQQAIAV
jgi:hypothetical protein